MSEMVWGFLGMEPSADEIIEQSNEVIQAVEMLEKRVRSVDGIRRQIECLKGIPSKAAPAGL